MKKQMWILIGLMILNILLFSFSLYALGAYSITITKPRVGEMVHPASNYTIKWTAIGGASGYVRLFYSINSGRVWIPIVTGPGRLSAATGNFEWHVPNLDTSNARIKAEWWSEAVPISILATDTTDGDFVIKRKTPVK